MNQETNRDRTKCIIVDAYGGDNAPLEILKGAALAVKDFGFTIVLTGNEPELRALADQHGISLENIEIVHAEDVIGMEEDPHSILKAHKECTMAKALRLLAEGQGDALVSAGSTGALIMGSTFLVKRIRGVSRAALAPIMPGDEGAFMLIDSGANADSRPEMLLQFAKMGSIYMTHVFGGGEPATVGLVNIGTEEGKGGTLQREAFELLRDSDLNFVGNLEARDIPYGKVRVVVADGFTGNVILKLTEGVAASLLSGIKGIFMKNWRTKLAALLVKGEIGAFKKRMDVSEYGGAPLLGVTRPVIKAHGNSNAAAIRSAIRVAAEFSTAGVIEKITEAVRPAVADDEERE